MSSDKFEPFHTYQERPKKTVIADHWWRGRIIEASQDRLGYYLFEADGTVHRLSKDRLRWEEKRLKTCPMLGNSQRHEIMEEKD